MDELLRENDDEQNAASDLVQLTSAISTDAPSGKYMKKKLGEHLGDNVVMSNLNGKPDIITLRSPTAKILQKFCQMPKMDNSVAETHTYPA